MDTQYICTNKIKNVLCAFGIALLLGGNAMLVTSDGFDKC